MCAYGHMCVFVSAHELIVICAHMCVCRTIFEHLGAVQVNRQGRLHERNVGSHKVE